MKNLVKVIGVTFLALIMLSVFVSCDHGSKGSNPQGTVYTLSADVDDLSLVIGKEDGIVNVTTNGTFTVEMENSNIASAVKNGKVVTVTGLKKGSTILLLTSVEDSSKTLEINIDVSKATASLTLNLADEIAVPGGTITVTYGNEQTEGLEYQTVTAVVSADGKTATAELAPELANEWGWFNGVVISVKDSNGEDVPITCDAYFEYNADGMELAVTAGILEKTFTLNFEGFEIPGGSVEGLKYTATENDWENAVEPEVTVSEDGTAATFPVAKANISSSSSFQLNLTSIVIKDSEGNVINPTDGVSEDIWGDYNEDWGKMSATIAIVELTDADYTGLIADNIAVPSDITEIVAASELAGVNAKAIKITYTVGEDDPLDTTATWITICSDVEWHNSTELVNAWNYTMRESDVAGNTYSVYITSSAVVEDFLTGGFFAASDGAAYTGKISITYVPAE